MKNKTSRAVAVTLALSLTGSAWAQTADPGPPPPTPPSDVPRTSEPPLVTEPETARLPKQFYDEFITVDYRGNASVGLSHRPLSRRDLFRLIGRTDLVEKSDSMISRRVAFIIAGAAVAVAGITGGIISYATAPDLTRDPCQQDLRTYNEICVPRANAHFIGGTVLMAVGAVGGALLFTLGYWSNPNVTSSDETIGLASKYNSQLKKRLLEAQPEARKPRPPSLKVAPVLLPTFAGLTARLDFE